MLTKLVAVVLRSNGKRTYILGLVVAISGVAVAAGVLSPEDAAQIRTLLETGWEQVFGLLTTVIGLAVITQRAGGQADTEALALQIAELKAALEAANKESGPR